VGVIIVRRKDVAPNPTIVEEWSVSRSNSIPFGLDVIRSELTAKLRIERPTRPQVDLWAVWHLLLWMIRYQDWVTQPDSSISRVLIFRLVHAPQDCSKAVLTAKHIIMLCCRDPNN
jgi:hypothetical protein